MNEETRSVRCMVLPLTSLNLVIPNSAVAEIIGYSTPQRLPDSSDWFSGVVLWRGVYVPVVAVEQMAAIDTAQVSPRARIAVVYNPQKDAALPYLGIHMQDIPRAYLADMNTRLADNDAGKSEFWFARIDNDQFARVIPDLDAIIVALKSEFSPEKLEQILH